MVLTREQQEREKLQNGPVIDEFTLEECPLEEDTTCGYGPFRGAFLQKMATKNMYVFFYGVLGLISSAQWAYFNGTINTMEKRFKIPSKILGFMNVASNGSQLFMSVILSYWAGRGHRPRWIAFSLVTGILQMMLTLLPHLIYGPGEEALLLTKEYVGAGNSTFDVLEDQRRHLCHADEICSEPQGSFVQPAILLLARFVGGIGGGLFHTVGLTYIDDNINKSESPMIFSLTFFFRMIGPTLGYALASACLNIYNAPFLTPTIANDDPRWIGAWWIGWIVLIFVTIIVTFPLSLFPKTLPETAAKRKIQNAEPIADEVPPSFKDLLVTGKRLLSNKLFLYNNASSIMYIIGETPYWIFLTKYIETEYQQSASVSNFLTGSIGIVTSATGMLLSGIVISRLRPSARVLSAWNATVGLITFFAFISFIFIHCESQITSSMTEFNATTTCNAACECEFAPYAPVCSEENETFISACHAGCQNVVQLDNDKVFTECSCVKNGLGTAKSGYCPQDCTWPLTAFIAILCIVRIFGAAGIASNVLVGVRCMEERDKTAGLGLSLTIRGVLGFGPGPIIYGYILDSTCLVWGKTCGGQGNCWMYDGPQLAFILNLASTFFLGFAVMFDGFFWHNSKNLKVFD